MRAQFPGYFRPTEKEFDQLWTDSIVAVDANVLLNLYRYSKATREELEKSLRANASRLFLPNQAAKEFLENRTKVTIDQSGEYSRACKTLRDFGATLSDRKRHPFIDEKLQPDLLKFLTMLSEHLESQGAEIANRLQDDEILRALEELFEGNTGNAYSEAELQAIAAEGKQRYEKRVPPGYLDAHKDGNENPLRIYGDLILWKQLLALAQSMTRPVIFVTDDKKSDWWHEQAGKTIGPRPELIEEFGRQTGQLFWMYSVERFVEENARHANTKVSEQVIEEIVEVRAEQRAESDALAAPRLIAKAKVAHPILGKDEILGHLTEYLAGNTSEDSAVGLRFFVVHYLGKQDYEINHSYAFLNQLRDEGKVEIFTSDVDGLKQVRIRLVR